MSPPTQISFGFSFAAQPTSFISNIQPGEVAFIQWTQLKSMLSGQLQNFWMNQETLKTESANYSFTGIRNNSSLSITLNDGQIITGSLHGNTLVLIFPLKDGTLASIKFKPGTIEAYNQQISDLNSKRNMTLAYQHFVLHLKDAKSRLKILPNLDTSHKGGFLERYESILMKMKSDYSEGKQIVQSTNNCFQREAVKSRVLSIINTDYSWSATAQFSFKNNIEDVFQSDIKKVRTDIDGAKKNLVAIESYAKSNNFNDPVLGKVDISKYFQEFSGLATNQVNDAASRFNGIREKIVFYKEEAKSVYDKSQKVFRFESCY